MRPSPRNEGSFGEWVCQLLPVCLKPKAPYAGGDHLVVRIPLRLVLPLIGMKSRANPTRSGYTRHEATAPRVAGPSGRTALFLFRLGAAGGEFGWGGNGVEVLSGEHVGEEGLHLVLDEAVGCEDLAAV